MASFRYRIRRVIALLGSPPGASQAPSRFQGSEQLLNLTKSNWFPLDFGELPIPNNPGYRDGLGLITRDTGPVRGRKGTSHREARGICLCFFVCLRALVGFSAPCSASLGISRPLFLLGCLALSGHLRASLGLTVPLWSSLGLFGLLAPGFLWASLSLAGPLWASLGLSVPLRISLGSPVAARAFTDLCGSLWASLGLF